MTTIRAATIIIFVLAAHSNPLFADQNQSSATPAFRDAVELGKGVVEGGGTFGVTLPITLFRAHDDRRLVVGSIQLGRVMTRMLGGGPLRGSLEMLVEVTPLFIAYQNERTVGVAGSPLHLRWNFGPMAAGAAAVFAEASGGLLYTRAPIPVTTRTNFNFIDQAGFGVRIRAGQHRSWIVGYRFQHISNGGRVRPNPGANFNFVYTGVSFIQ